MDDRFSWTPVSLGRVTSVPGTDQDALEGVKGLQLLRRKCEVLQASQVKLTGFLLLGVGGRTKFSHEWSEHLELSSRSVVS